jgi:hypothetical protein
VLDQHGQLLNLAPTQVGRLVGVLALLINRSANVNPRGLGKPLELVERIVRYEIIGQEQSGQDSFLTGQALGSVVRAH